MVSIGHMCFRRWIRCEIAWAQSGPWGGGVIYISHPNWVVLGCVDFDLLDADDLHKARQTQRV